MGPQVRAVYVSYDGALDPLGASQVVPYILGLAARGARMSLISFEKPERWVDTPARKALQERLNAAGVSWSPLVYHRRPRLPATMLDIVAGRLRIRRLVRASGASLVHCRGDVAMAMARWARLAPQVRLLYDVRGFFADERAESGSWRPGGLLDRLVRGIEAGNLRSAHGIVVLTETAVSVLAQRRPSLPPLRVIPTCVDLSLFSPPEPGAPRDYALAYSGSLGTWYMASEMVAFARVASASLGGRTLFLTPQTEEARRAGATPDWAEVRTVAPAEVPRWLRRARAAFFFYSPTPARRATCPTKLAESLATGLPIVANRGVGDLDSILESEGVGVQVESFTEEAYRGAAVRLASLLRDVGTTARCRGLAEKRYSLASGVAAYHDLYRALVREASRPALV
jgi:glycosyltransferase involved in cell wall biosynthesis